MATEHPEFREIYAEKLKEKPKTQGKYPCAFWIQNYQENELARDEKKAVKIFLEQPEADEPTTPEIGMSFAEQSRIDGDTLKRRRIEYSKYRSTLYVTATTNIFASEVAVNLA